MRDLKKVLYPARAKWHSIGVELDVELSDLDDIEDRYASKPDGNGRCLEEMIRKSNRNLAKVLTALREETVDEEALAHDIEKKYRSLHEAGKCVYMPHTHFVIHYEYYGFLSVRFLNSLLDQRL